MLLVFISFPILILFSVVFNVLTEYAVELKVCSYNYSACLSFVFVLTSLALKIFKCCLNYDELLHEKIASWRCRCFRTCSRCSFRQLHGQWTMVM
jgi:hypothetical protein